jgi:heme peroxidase
VVGILSSLIGNVAERLDRRFSWYRLPGPVALFTLIGLRNRLRERNLFDTGLPDPPEGRTLDPRFLTARTVDGTYNDLEQPMMGSVGTRFGRNVPLSAGEPEPRPRILQPNPRTVSRELLTRDRFLPATSLNVLAAAWIQFEVHDWLSHGRNDFEHPWELPLADDDDWPERPMRIPATRPDSTAVEGGPTTFQTADSHWWDASQVYGSVDAFASKERAGVDGKLRIGDDGLPPRDLDEGLDLSDVPGNFWIGLGVLHTLFMLEHNAICDRLRRDYPSWTDEQLYDKARLINSALMAKIHTVEWTPAVIAHPTTIYAIHGNWWGLMGERRRGRRGLLHDSELLYGIPGSATDHHGVPYSLTEEFVAVYRMHPLLPDEFTFRSPADGSLLETRTFPEVGVLHTRERLTQLSVANVIYSLGVANPGAITLHNYPRFLQHFDRADGTILDLAATDILRNRERGVPRYNQFRRFFRLKPAASFEELTDNPVWADEMRTVYDGKIEDVDLMVGMYAEHLPPGFAFSDTAFRVFILMASRRLKSDRFLSRDYNARVYTQAGIDWLNENSMVSILRRHYPSLGPTLDGVSNAFAPWHGMP